ncbi:hypothetical protein AgCh_017648 [Apium graveolens]
MATRDTFIPPADGRVYYSTAGCWCLARVTPTPGQSWATTIGQIFGQISPDDIFNKSRIWLTWFESLTPAVLRADAWVEEIRHLARCYLIQLLGGSLFTDHSGGAIHSMWVHFVRDLDAFRGYAWGLAVLARLYRKTCSGCKAGTQEVAGCLQLLQMWAWDKLPTLAHVQTTAPLVDVAFWENQLAGPHGLRWLVGHSFVESDGRTVATARMALDELAPATLLPRASRYDVEGPEGLGLCRVPEYMDWYLARTVRFLSHLGALLVHLGVSLQALADGTQHLPDMFQIATQSLYTLRDRHAYVFDPLPVEEQDARPDEGGRMEVIKEAELVVGDAVVVAGEAVLVAEEDHVGTGEDRGPESSTAATATATATATVGEVSAAASTATVAEASTPAAATANVAEASTAAADDEDWPSYSLGIGMTRTSQPVPEQQTSHMPDTSIQQPPPVIQRQHRIRPWHGISEIPPFDLGTSSQSPLSMQSSQPGTQRSSTRADRPDPEAVYVRRSKRDRKAPDCGTGSHR